MQLRRPALASVVLLAAACACACARAQTPAPFAPPTAAQVMAEARTRAAAGQRNILLIFHASWCGWCRQLDKFIETPENKAIVDRYFLVVHLTVEERGDKAGLNNSGGEELRAWLGGKSSGLPFIAFLDPAGALIVNSMRPVPGNEKGWNIGHPSEPAEIDWFMVMLKKAAPAMSAGEAATLEAWLRKPPKK